MSYFIHFSRLRGLRALDHHELGQCAYGHLQGVETQSEVFIAIRLVDICAAVMVRVGSVSNFRASTILPEADSWNVRRERYGIGALHGIADLGRIIGRVLRVRLQEEVREIHGLTVK